MYNLEFFFRLWTPIKDTSRSYTRYY